MDITRWEDCESNRSRHYREKDVKRGADAVSDHHLVVADLKVKLKVYRDRANRPSHKYNVYSMKDKTKAEVYQHALRYRFSALAHQPEVLVKDTWRGLRDTLNAICNNVLGKKTRQHKEWLSANAWTIINERKQLKNDINQTQDSQQKQDLQAQYLEFNRQVKKSTRADKRSFIHDLTIEAETAGGKRDMKRLYDITRTLLGKNKTPSRPVKDKKGETIADEAKERESKMGRTLLRDSKQTPTSIPS